jgi:integrase
VWELLKPEVLPLSFLEKSYFFQGIPVSKPQVRNYTNQSNHALQTSFQTIEYPRTSPATAGLFCLKMVGKRMASDFLFACNQILKHNRDGSFATQTDRRRTFALIDRQLRELGINKLKLKNLGSRHVEALLNRWQQEGLSAGTIKNRMAHIRWMSEKIGKNGLISQNNAILGIEARQYVTNRDLSSRLDLERLKLVCDERLEVSFRLQQFFGLRREECMKIQPNLADCGDVLRLKKTKGNRPREVPIRTLEQRALLERAKLLAAGGSMIPPELSYKQQKNRYTYACVRMGLSKAHGLRHLYAQQRYLELTGRPCAACGGLKRGEMSSEIRQEDRKIRQIITEELGHTRDGITSTYLGC